MPRSFIFIHGHDYKPAPEHLMALWSAALQRGVERDVPDKLPLFQATHAEMVYYGDITRALLDGRGSTYDERLDIADRRHALAALSALAKRKQFKRLAYQALPGKSAAKELAADIGAPLLRSVGLAKPVIARLLPELDAYWRDDDGCATRIVDRAMTLLGNAMDSGDELMLITHGTGAIVAYDALWNLSHAPEHAARRSEQKVDLWLTLGCPLGDETVKGKLAGATLAGAARYPANVLSWINVSAEDDYMCHDKTLADDFKGMLKAHLISSITDFRIYNLAVRYGRSNPHNILGYLIHPRVAMAIGNWLS